MIVKAAKSGTIQFIEPMYALAVQNIPEGKEWLYEVNLRLSLPSWMKAAQLEAKKYSETQTAQ